MFCVYQRVQDMRHLQGVSIVVCISVYVVGETVSMCITPKLITSTNGFFQCLEVSLVLLLLNLHFSCLFYFQLCLAFSTLSCIFFSSVILYQALQPDLRVVLVGQQSKSDWQKWLLYLEEKKKSWACGSQLLLYLM